MTSLRRPLAVVALVGMFMAMWTAHSERDVGVAQSRKPMTMTRIYTGADGLSHAEDVEMTLTGNGTAEMKATRAVQPAAARPGERLARRAAASVRDHAERPRGAGSGRRPQGGDRPRTHQPD